VLSLSKLILLNQKATLKAIAEQLQMSISTVSRALKNHPDISEATRKKVTELANMMEYEPNAYAVSLRTNNSRVFCIMVPAVSNLFYHSFVSAVEEEARKENYSLLILQSGDNPATEIDNLKLCRQNRATGVFVSISPQTTNIDHFNRMVEQGVPVIFFDKVPTADNCNKVCLADSEVGKMAARKLLEKKKKNILAIFGNPDLSITKKRMQGFVDEMNTNGSGAKHEVYHAKTAAEANQFFHLSFKNGQSYDAVFCMSDEILTGVMKGVQELGISIPKQLGIISISNGFVPQLYHPEISYVETSGYKLGKLAFNRMLSCMSGNTATEELTLDSVFVEGGSI
jgi:LacI family transcriptional regulator